jgi:hypothetical protein
MIVENYLFNVIFISFVTFGSASIIEHKNNDIDRKIIKEFNIIHFNDVYNLHVK